MGPSARSSAPPGASPAAIPSPSAPAARTKARHGGAFQRPAALSSTHWHRYRFALSRNQGRATTMRAVFRYSRHASAESALRGAVSWYGVRQHTMPAGEPRPPLSRGRASTAGATRAGDVPGVRDVPRARRVLPRGSPAACVPHHPNPGGWRHARGRPNDVVPRARTVDPVTPSTGGVGLGQLTDAPRSCGPARCRSGSHSDGINTSGRWERAALAMYCFNNSTAAPGLMWPPAPSTSVPASAAARVTFHLGKSSGAGVLRWAT